MLAVVDFDMMFTYVLAGWEGSTHDANILNDIMSCSDGINIPESKFYLGDDGYACRPGLLPPFRKVRYHLNGFVGRNYPRTPHELFNLKYSSLRVTIERAFVALKNRFKNRSHSTLSPLRLSLFLLVSFCIIESCNGVVVNWCLKRKM